MREGWIRCNLSEITTKIGSGATPLGGDAAYKKSGISLIRSLNVHDGSFRLKDLAFIDELQAGRLSNVIVEPDDVLLNITGASVARCCIVPRDVLPARVNQHVSIIRPKADRLSAQLLQYLLVSATYKDRLLHTGEGAGSTRQALTKAQLQSFEIEFPESLDHQQRIVALLDEAFDGIATAQANAEKNLQNARALFESHLQSVFSHRGEGWVKGSIGETCTLRSGTTVSATLEKKSGDLPYLKVADMNLVENEMEVVTSSRFLNQTDVGKNSILPIGTTIFPKRGGSILTNKKRLTSLEICADLNIMGVIPGKKLHPKYLYFYFINIDMRRISSGSSIPQINNYDIEPLQITFPESTERQKQIVFKLEGLSAETQRLESIYQQKLAALAELKKSLLHQAFSGAL